MSKKERLIHVFELQINLFDTSIREVTVREVTRTNRLICFLGVRGWPRASMNFRPRDRWKIQQQPIMKYTSNFSTELQTVDLFDGCPNMLIYSQLCNITKETKIISNCAWRYQKLFKWNKSGIFICRSPIEWEII